MSDKIWFDPTSDKWVLSDGEHYLEVPYWAREIIADEFERETRQLKTENAKLRELAAGIGHLLFSLDVDYCAGCPRDDINHPCPVYTVKGGDCLYETDLRELGVEVDE